MFGAATRTPAGSPAKTMAGGMTAAFTAASVVTVLTFLVALTFRRRETV